MNPRLFARGNHWNDMLRLERDPDIGNPVLIGKMGLQPATTYAHDWPVARPDSNTSIPGSVNDETSATLTTKYHTPRYAGGKRNGRHGSYFAKFGHRKTEQTQRG